MSEDEIFACGSFLLNIEKEERRMKKNRYATNSAGVIKAPNAVKDSPKATVVKGEDLRGGKTKKK